MASRRRRSSDWVGLAFSKLIQKGSERLISSSLLPVQRTINVEGIMVAGSHVRGIPGGGGGGNRQSGRCSQIT